MYAQSGTCQDVRTSQGIVRTNPPRTFLHVRLGDRVRNLRKACGWTQEQLAKRADLRRTEINRIERGTNQASSHAMRQSLAKGFEISTIHLDLYLSGALQLKDARGYVGEERPVPVLMTARTPSTGADEHTVVRIEPLQRLGPRRRRPVKQIEAYTQPEPGPAARAIARLGTLLWPDAVTRILEIDAAGGEERSELGWVQVSIDVQRELEASRTPPPPPPAAPVATPAKRRRAS